MFGGNSPKVEWHWFWPGAVKFPRGMDKVVLGYEWDESMLHLPYQEESSRSEDDGDGDHELRDLEAGRGGKDILSPPSSGSAQIPPPQLPGRSGTLTLRMPSDVSLDSTTRPQETGVKNRRRNDSGLEATGEPVLKGTLA